MDVNRSIKILLGFNLEHRKMDRDTEDKLRKYLQAYGYEPSFITRREKKEIQKYLQENRDCSHAILMESADDSVWTENELAELVDERNINLVIILTAQKAKQLTFLTTLYAAGITSAIFEQGGHGVPEETVAEFLIRPRSRKAAREYYRIDTKNISIRSLTHEMYDGLSVKLADPEYGTSVMERFLTIAGSLNPYQLGDFILKLPEKITDELSQYAEYGQLLTQLKESGIHIRYRRPKVYRHLEDDLPFNESAGEAVKKAGFDASVYRKPAYTPKKGLFGGRKKKGLAQGKEDAPTEQGSETREEIIETITPFYTWESEGWGEEIPVGEAVDIDLEALGAEPKVASRQNKASSSPQDDDDDFLIY